MSGLYYETQTTGVLVGSKTSAGTRTSIALTTAYDVANKTKAIETGGFSKINIDILYTMGATESSNSIEMRAECSNDGVNYYRIPNETVSGGTSTLTRREFTYVGTDAAAATISIGLDIFYKWMKFSFKETGVATNAGTVFAEYTLSGK
jgi:hypothetical protein